MEPSDEGRLPWDGEPPSSESGGDPSFERWNVDDNGAAIQFKRVGARGTVVLKVCVGKESITDKADVTKASTRERLGAQLVARFPQLDASTVQNQLESIAEQVVNSNECTAFERSQADEIVRLIDGVTLFHTPGGYDSEGFAAIDVAEHREVWAVNSRAFRRWLGKQHYDAFGKAPGSSAIDDALMIIASKAIYDGPEEDVAVRIGAVGDKIYLDLADPEWRVVEITASGWRVLPGKDAPIRFIRKRGMLALRAPERGGSIEELRPLLNLQDDTSWVLLVGCMLGHLRPVGPFPILIVDGEQGSAKSTLGRFVVRCIDPRKPELRRPPRSEHDLVIAAANGWLVAFDNLSGLQPWLSDSLCCLATGGGFSARQLYSDDDERLFDAMRPVLMNGIDQVATRSDLLDRAVHLHLPAIPEEKRRSERELNLQFEAALPRFLGALLTGLSCAIRCHRSVQLGRLPRMADFATWVVAAEEALGWAPGTFLDAYRGNRQEANVTAVDSSLIGPPVLALLEQQAVWDGSASDLLTEVERLAPQKSLEERAWPRGPAAFSRALRRIAPNLRAVGVVVEFPSRTGGQRRIHLECGSYRASSDGSAEAGDSSQEENRHLKTDPPDIEKADRDSNDSNDASAGSFPDGEFAWEA